MNEIRCPNCGKIFQIDEKDYDSIVKQIKNHEIKKIYLALVRGRIKEREATIDMPISRDEKNRIKICCYRKNAYLCTRNDETCRHC